eukprot:6075144-Prymnesium_polylepis.1
MRDGIDRTFSFEFVVTRNGQGVGKRHWKVILDEGLRVQCHVNDDVRAKVQPVSAHTVTTTSTSRAWPVAVACACGCGLCALAILDRSDPVG